jgi:4,5-DOPA dioxygenase extradiol
MSINQLASGAGAAHVLHLAHGTPDFALPDRTASRRWREVLEDVDPQAYEAVVVISAHGSVKGHFAVLAGGVSSPPLLHDYRGFDPALAESALDVPAASEDLRTRVLTGLGGLGLSVRDSPDRPLDHGVWVPLLGGFGTRLSVPVFSLGLPLEAPLERVREWGVRLASLPLRILWITSGGIVHNLAALAWDEPEGPPYGWARDFWTAVEQHLSAEGIEPLLDPWKLPGGSLAVPTREHYAPFVVALGLAGRAPLPRATGFAYRSLSLEVLVGGGLGSLRSSSVAGTFPATAIPSSPLSLPA